MSDTPWQPAPMASGSVPLASQALAVVAGLCFAAGYVVEGWSAPEVAVGAPAVVLVEAVLHALMLPLLLWMLLRALAGAVLPRLALATEATVRLWRLQSWALLVWPAAAWTGWRIGFTTALTLAALAVYLVAQGFLLSRALAPRQREAVARSGEYVAVLFFVSGFAALIYQVVWQRILFTQFGVNSESITAIVSVFMAGLGLGALAGGWLQRRFPQHLLKIFIGLEVGIGLFGMVSARVIEAASPTGAVTVPDLIVRVYAVLAIPTLLMGATLPVLIAHLQNRFRNIGRTVSLLYALNTFGSAVAAFATVQVLFVLGGLRSSILVAVCCNFATAWLLYRAARTLAAAPKPAALPEPANPHVQRAPMPYAWALLGLAGVGYLSLSLEILWFRLLSFLSGSRPEVFGVLLAVSLAGIGWGAWEAERQSRDDGRARALAVRALVLAAFGSFFALTLVSWTTALVGKGVGLALGYAAAGLVAYWCGRTFPTLVQLGTPDGTSSAAMPVAWLYFGNVVGAAFGPLVTGFVLLDRFPLSTNMLLMAAAALVLAAVLAGREHLLRSKTAVTGIAAAAVAAFALHAPLNAGYLERLQYAATDAQPFRHERQDRTAIVTVEAATPDIVFGHGMYDGRFNTDPVTNSNMVDRAYMVAALHPAPQRVLEIGLSTGSWTEVLASYEPVQELVVVEIGRSYQSLLPLYPAVAGVLTNPKVRLHVDDGRRWMKNHPQETFDLIVMNTSFPWRANSSNLLSTEFLALAKSRLRPGGVIYYNSLGYDHVPYTAAHVFRHVTRFSTAVAASDAPLQVDAATRRRNLLLFRTDAGEPLFTHSDALRKKFEQLAEAPLPELRESLLARRDLRPITDDNMSTEYKVRY